MVLSVFSCDKMDTAATVDFPQEGGTKTVLTKMDIDTISICDMEGSSAKTKRTYDEELGLKVENDWLTVTMQPDSDMLSVTATENSSASERKLKVTGAYGDLSSEILVKQKGL